MLAMFDWPKTVSLKLSTPSPTELRTLSIIEETFNPIALSGGVFVPALACISIKVPRVRDSAAYASTSSLRSCALFSPGFWEAAIETDLSIADLFLGSTIELSGVPSPIDACSTFSWPPANWLECWISWVSGSNFPAALARLWTGWSNALASVLETITTLRSTSYNASTPEAFSALSATSSRGASDPIALPELFFV